jgi:hypothetical protein
MTVWLCRHVVWSGGASMAMGRPPERGHGVRRVFSQAHAKIGRHEIAIQSSAPRSNYRSINTCMHAWACAGCIQKNLFFFFFIRPRPHTMYRTTRQMKEHVHELYEMHAISLWCVITCRIQERVKWYSLGHYLIRWCTLFSRSKFDFWLMKHELYVMHVMSLNSHWNKDFSDNNFYNKWHMICR